MRFAGSIHCHPPFDKRQSETQTRNMGVFQDLVLLNTTKCDPLRQVYERCLTNVHSLSSKGTH
jgi:hypothetical protein